MKTMGLIEDKEKETGRVVWRLLGFYHIEIKFNI